MHGNDKVGEEENVWKRKQVVNDDYYQRKRKKKREKEKPKMPMPSKRRNHQKNKL